MAIVTSCAWSDRHMSDEVYVLQIHHPPRCTRPLSHAAGLVRAGHGLAVHSEMRVAVKFVAIGEVFFKSRLFCRLPMGQFL